MFFGKTVKPFALVSDQVMWPLVPYPLTFKCKRKGFVLMTLFLYTSIKMCLKKYFMKASNLLYSRPYSRGFFKFSCFSVFRFPAVSKGSMETDSVTSFLCCLCRHLLVSLGIVSTWNCLWLKVRRGLGSCDSPSAWRLAASVWAPGVEVSCQGWKAVRTLCVSVVQLHPVNQTQSLQNG